MCKIQEAKAVLRGAEVSLRTLMEEGLKQQRYVDVAEIARLAEGLARLLGVGSVASNGSATEAPTIRTRTPKKSHSSGKTRKRNAKSYPRFETDGDRLVKTGWSKKKKSEYEHRAPRSAVVAFINYLTSSVQPGQLFAIEDILPIPGSDGNDVPTYQVYLTLAWLRESGEIEKRGRDGYLFREGDMSTQKIDSLWTDAKRRDAT